MPIDRNEIYEKILEENGSIIYLSDIKTHALIYINCGGLNVLGRPRDDTTYIGQPCYAVLQGFSSPCDFCNNARLGCGHFDTWEHYNPMLRRYFSIRDKKVRIGGQELRMEIADDITQTALEKQRLQRDLSAEKSLMLCIQKLTAAESRDQSIHELLEKICDLYQGERGYIFQFDYENRTISNTYEWCREGVEAEIDRLQRLPLEVADAWIAPFQTTGDIRIEDLQREIDHESLLYSVLAPQGIVSLVAVPLLKGEQIIGFLGVDNPIKNPEDLSLLETVAQFVSNDIEKRRILESLERISNIDLLAEVFNRNRYTTDLEALDAETARPVGVVFLDLDGLKRLNDTCGHDCGDKIIRRAAAILYDIFPDEVYRIGGDEFVVLSRNLHRAVFEKRVRDLRSRFHAEGVAISMGVEWRRSGGDLGEAVLRADRLMYQEKAAGKYLRL